MLKWSRVRLYLSVLTCAGLIATLRERIQYVPGGAKLKKKSSPVNIPKSPANATPACYDYAGALHVHSTYSDGAGTVPQVAEAANAAGLDFVVLCDHSNLDARRDGHEGWHERSLMLVGTEITTDTGHLLALNVPESFVPAPLDSVEAQRNITDSGGIGFIALPCDLKDHWRDFDKRQNKIGLEVFNLSAIARTKINLPGLALVWQRYMSPNPLKAFHLVSARPNQELRLWDSLMIPTSSESPLQPVVGVASVDAHAIMKFGRKSFPYPTYEQVFRTLRTHVVTRTSLSYGEGGSNLKTPEDANTIYRALAQGRCYMSYDNYGDATGFLFEAIVDIGSSEITVAMGDSVVLPSGANSLSSFKIRLSAKTPRPRSFLRLYHNGRLVDSSRGGQLSYAATQPGAYRIEAYLYRYRIGSLCFGAKPWIFSNPIYVQPTSVVSRPQGSTTKMPTFAG